MKRKFLVIKLLIVFLFGIIGISQATPYTEIGDAGELMPTAQNIGGGFNTITGSLGSGSDLFALQLTAGSFGAEVTFRTFDTQLFLFNSTGFGIVANDDISDSNYASYFSTTLSYSGLYYLGISAYDNDPISTTGEIFDDFWTGIVLPTVPGGGTNPLSGWSGSGSGRGYTIELSQTTTPSNPVPEPATLLLFGMGILGIAGVSRKKLQE